MNNLSFYTSVFAFWFVVVFAFGKYADWLIGLLYKGGESSVGTPAAHFLNSFGVKAHHLSGSRLIGAWVLAWLMLRFGTDLSLWIMIPSGIILALTDAFDGPLARQSRSTSALGKLIDTIADKFFKIVYSVRFIQLPVIGLVLWIMYGLYLFSGIALVTNSGKMSSERLADTFEANHFGKAKMFCQCMALGALYLFELFPKWAILEIPGFLLVSSLPFELKSQFEKARAMYKRKKLKRGFQVVTPEAG